MLGLYFIRNLTTKDLVLKIILFLLDDNFLINSQRNLIMPNIIALYNYISQVLKFSVLPICLNCEMMQVCTVLRNHRKKAPISRHDGTCFINNNNDVWEHEIAIAVNLSAVTYSVRKRKILCDGEFICISV